MFYTGNLNQIGLNKQKRMIKLRTSAGEQDSQVRRILQSSRDPTRIFSNTNKEHKVTLRRQNKRFTECQPNDKKYGKVSQLYHNNGLLGNKQNQLGRNNLNYITPPIKTGRNQNNQLLDLHESIVQHKSKMDRLFNQRDRNNFLNQPDFSITQRKTSQNSLIKARTRRQQSQNRLTTDRTNINITKRMLQKVKSLKSNKIKNLKSQCQGKRVIYYQSSSIKGSKEVNQDTVKTGDGVWIVCDGHGQFGHNVSWFTANLLFQLYNQKISKQRFSKSIFKQIFIQVQQHLQQSQIDISLSGSTCVMVVINSHKIYCASIGDSVAILISQDNGCEVISSEHKPCNPEQAKRIQFFGGMIKKTYGKQHLASSPLRLWGQGIDYWGPGLAISRSFGDKMAQKYGLIYQPQIKQISLSKSNKYIVLGSDGLFDQLRPTQIANILNAEGRDEKFEGCRLLTQVAQSRWIGYADDISGIVIYL